MSRSEWMSEYEAPFHEDLWRSFASVLDLRLSESYSSFAMPSVAQTLAVKLEEWDPEVSQEVEVLVADIIALADLNVLDLARSRRVEQDVLDLLDEPITG